MTSATEACDLLAYEQLSENIIDAAVYQDVPDTAPLPMVIIGDMESVPFAGANDPDRRITLTLVVLTEGDERAPCSALQSQIETIMAGQSFLVGNWNLHVSLDSADAALSDDGSGYIGTTMLTILAFRDD
jgi:hypothetical protein